MKKLIFTLVPVFLLICSSVTANNTVDNLPIIAKTKIVKDKIIQLNLANLQKNYTRVEITNFDKSTLYFGENIHKHNGYINRVNLNQLPDGRYFVIVKHKKEEIKQIIKITNGQIYLSHFKK